MSTDNYSVCLIILACFLSYFGLSLLLVEIPTRLRESVYKTSRRFMGGAFLVLALSIIIFLVFRLRDLPPSYRVALNLSCYYIAAKLFAISFITLVDKKIRLRHIATKWHHNIIHTYPILVWGIILIEDPEIARYIRVVAAAILLIEIILDIKYFFKAYNKTIEIGEFYYSEGIGVHISWMIKSVYYIIAIGISSSCVAIFTDFIPKQILFIYLTCVLGVCIYIFNQFMRFAIRYSYLTASSESAELVPDVEIDNIQLSPRILQHLNKQIALWIASKEYCNHGVTILSAASQMLSNRLYLSNYINMTYKCSFKVWISILRVNEAKRIISLRNGETLTTIAKQVGFLSLPSFTHAFKRIEGISPKEWARNHL